MYLKQKYEVFSLVVGATAVNSLDWEQIKPTTSILRIAAIAGAFHNRKLEIL